MASTPVTLKVKDYVDREVLHVNYEFDQATDVEGQIAGIPRGGKIHVKVKALNDGNPDLLAWMVEPNLPKDGKVDFLETKGGKAMKSIEFTKGYCVEFHERWEEGLGHYEEITITCKEIKFGNVVYDNKWA